MARHHRQVQALLEYAVFIACRADLDRWRVRRRVWAHSCAVTLAEVFEREAVCEFAHALCACRATVTGARNSGRSSSRFAAQPICCRLCAPRSEVPLRVRRSVSRDACHGRARRPAPSLGARGASSTSARAISSEAARSSPEARRLILA